MFRMMAVLAIASLAACAHESSRDEEPIQRIDCRGNPGIPRYERFPIIQQKMIPLMGQSEQVVTSVLERCKIGRSRGRTAKYKCRVLYYDGCPHPNAEITVTFTDGVATNWNADDL